MLKLTTKVTDWFDVPQDASGECKVKILHLKPGEVAAIEAKSNDIVGKQVGDDFQTEIEFRLHERTMAYIVAAVVDMKGFVDANDKPVKCDKQGKLSVLKEFDWFADFVEKCRDLLATRVEKGEEGADPN